VDPCKPDESLIDLGNSIRNSGWRRLYSQSSWLWEKPLGIRKVNAVYDEVRNNNKEPFFTAGLQALGVRYRYNPEEAKQIPPSGPVFIIANHPYGGVDGVILGDFLQSIRPDFRLLVNSMLLRIPELENYVFGVNPFGGSTSIRENGKPIKDALDWVRNGHLLATFPAGEVSHFRLSQKRVTDSEWHPVCAKLIRKSKATVVPIFFGGKNSRFFQIMGTIHPRIRTVLLLRELVNKNGREISIRIGRSISPSKVEDFDNDNDLLDYLRLKTYLISANERKVREPFLSRPHFKFGISSLYRKETAQVKPLIEPTSIEKIRREIAKLPAENCLLHKKKFFIYCFHGKDSPVLLLELGRLRELAFREAHEGTGEPYDTDHFDSDYLQLFLWDDENSCIVGGYRIGQTDLILPLKRKRGFYTSTLFRFRTAFLEKLDPALELGRSFIVPEYQRKFATLSLIWQGIGAFVSRNPRYRYLFGPVSINCEYETISKDLIIHFLRGNNFDSILSAKVKAKSPPTESGLLSKEEREAILRGVKTIDDVSTLIAEIEPDRKGVPTLLRHYVKLNARFLSFNVDADFSDVLDGLMIVDLLKTDTKTVRFFMGPEKAEEFYQYHGKKEDTLAACGS